jgi:parvulin-like peptidyl-prolyl isomerase
MPRLCPRSAHAGWVGSPKRLLAVAAFVVVLQTLVGAAAAGPAPSPAASVLATVGEATITVADLEREMARRAGSRPGTFATAESRRQLLEELVAGRLRVEAARAAGYENDPEIVRALEILLAAKLEREQLEPLLAELAVSDEEIDAHYRSAPELYTTPEQVRVALIRIDVPAQASEERRAEVEAATAAILAEAPAIDSAQGFGDLARRYSADGASRYVGGGVGWLVRGDRYRWPDAVVDAAFACTDPGGTDAGGTEPGCTGHGDVGVVDTEGARYLVRRLERRPAARRPVETVADGIRRELLRQKHAAASAEFYARLRRQFPVEVDAAALELVALPASPTPPTVPGH